MLVDLAYEDPELCSCYDNPAIGASTTKQNMLIYCMVRMLYGTVARLLGTGIHFVVPYLALKAHPAFSSVFTVSAARSQDKMLSRGMVKVAVS